MATEQEDQEWGLVGQHKVIERVRRLVDEWRGFPLGRASDPYPDNPPRYEPAAPGEFAITETTMALLQHWFRQEPHTLGSGALFKYWPHQRRLVETFIYLHEVRRVRRTEDLYRLADLEPLGPQRDPWVKLGGELATGSGKTKMMSLLVAWWHLNAVTDPGNSLGAGRHAIVIAPGLFVRDRLFQDFFPPHGGTPVFFADPVIPPELESSWSLKVYSPVTCPLRLDPEEGALVVTNYHQLLRTRAEAPETARKAPEQRTLEMLFELREPERLEAIQSPLIERFARSRGLLVLNDEAHNVGDEPGHARFEEKARERAALGGDDESIERAWIRSIRRLNGSDAAAGRVTLQVDMSATLFEEAGADKKPARGGRSVTTFKPADRFRHTAVHYGLPDAIRDGIVKRPILERLEVRNRKTGAVESPIREGQPNAWEKYRNLLMTGIERWKKVREQLADEGDPRKPILFIMCDDKNEAREVANYLAHGEASRETIVRTPTGFRDEETGETLFVETGADGVTHSTVIEIHIGEREDRSDADWERVRQAVNAVDHDEIPDPTGSKDEHGRPILIPNPYNVVVSVMMLKEGWDVRNVKVIVPLRPCDSRTLTEQTLGRGLRKMHAPMIEEDGSVSMKDEELYVIEHPSFAAVLDQIKDIVEEKSSEDITHAREYVPILQRADEAEREQTAVRLVKFEGLVEVVSNWSEGFDFARVPALVPRVAWMDQIGEIEIHTFLKRAMAAAEEEGQEFIVPEAPTYQSFDHVIEVAHVRPLLRELRVSHQHKNAVKEVVRRYLEQKTFALPAGVPLAFDRAIEAGQGRIALANLARAEVIEGIRGILVPALHEAITAQRRATRANMSERRSSELPNYQALKKFVRDAPARCNFDRQAMGNEDERRVAMLLDQCSDVVGWVYNHRSGVGYAIVYDWQGYTARYFPDFIVRARIGEVFHNFIIEVKGRLDDRDKEKARRGRAHCEILTEYDGEPWHYLMLIENAPVNRNDISWWSQASVKSMVDLLARMERLPLFPDETTQARPEVAVVPDVRRDEEFQVAVPVHDLTSSAGSFSDVQSPSMVGWMRIQSTRRMERRMFVARVSGHSMEPSIPDGSWCLFRAFAAGEAPSATSLDGRRVVVQLRDEADPDLGGQYTLKRWRVTRLLSGGAVEEIELRPDNPSHQPWRMRAEDGEIRVVAEFLEVVG